MFKLILYALFACIGLISIGLLPYALWAVMRYRLRPHCRTGTTRPGPASTLTAITDP